MNFEEIGTDWVLDLVKQSPMGYGNILRHKHPDFIKYLNTKYNTDKIGEALFLFVHKNVGNKCKLCGNKTNFKEFSYGYFDFCSYSCRAKYNKSNKNGTTEQAINKRKEWRNSLTKEQLDKIYLNRKITPPSKDALFKMCVNRHGEFAANRLNDIGWLKEEYLNNKLTIEAIAKKLDVSINTVYNKIRKFNIKREKEAGKSIEEFSIISYLKDVGVQNILLNNKKLISPLEVDVYLPDFNLAIEYCGCYWHSDSNKHINQYPAYHQNKFLKLKEKGIKLITLFDVDWKFKNDIVKSRLSNLLNITSDKIFARKCVIKELTNEHIKFLNDNHLFGNTSCTIKLGLYYNDELVSVMTFRTPRYNKNYQWELIRFASKLNTNVIGGANKLFKYFLDKYKPDSIISYSDNCWGDCSLYNKLGFSFKEVSKPSYFYVKLSELKTSGKKYHRSTFMKSKIVKKLNGDPGLTEKENMIKLGYYRVWDCGTSVWIR